MANQGSKEQSVCEPEVSVVRAELEKILASDTFARSERLRRFLRFAVENRLDGKTALLKESVIGVEVFDRPPTYDPKSEPIVRIEARRLREKLQHYYAAEGSRDPAVIQLPRGGYIPTFEARANEPIAFPLQVVSTRPEAPPARSFPRARGFLATLLLLAVAAAGFFLGRVEHAPAPLAIIPLTAYGGMEMHPSVSPDGKQLAFTWDAESDNFDIYVKLLDRGTPLRLTTNPGHDLYPAWSPDGKEIAFLRVSPGKQEIVAIPALGGSERRLAEVSARSAAWMPNPAAFSSFAGPSWSPDGKSLLVVDRPSADQPDSIYLVSVETGEKRRVTTPPRESGGDSAPKFSPDGARIAFVRASGAGAADLWVQPARGGTPAQITSDRRNINGIAWSRDGSRIIFASNRSGPFKLWSVAASGGAPHPIDAAGNSVLYPSISIAGLAFAESLLNLNVWRVPVAGGPAVRVISSSRRNHSAQYSPDGKRIAFVSTRSGAEEIWICDAAGSPPQKLTSFGGPVTGTPRWAPSGDRIAFDSRVQGHSAIFVIGAEGGKPARLTAASSDDSRPGWSHDGRWIYFTSNRGGSAQIWKMPSGGGAALQVTHSGGLDPVESSDGATLYYTKSAGGLWMLPLSGGEERPVSVLTSLGASRCWAVSADGIYFIAESEPQSIQFFAFANKQASTIARVERRVSLTTPSLSVSPDGRSVLYAQVDDRGSDVSLLKDFR